MLRVTHSVPRNGDDIRRLQAAFQAAGDDSIAEGPCPTAQQLWHSARGTLSADGQRAIADHLARCGGCAEIWRTARGADD